MSDYLVWLLGINKNYIAGLHGKLYVGETMDTTGGGGGGGGAHPQGTEQDKTTLEDGALFFHYWF